jgi:ankyrin repeat protein
MGHPRGPTSFIAGPGSTEDRQLALSLAADLGHVEIVRLLLDAGEDPNRYNPVGGLSTRHRCTKLLGAAMMR